jgi:hypothetical protein
MEGNPISDAGQQRLIKKAKADSIRSDRTKTALGTLLFCWTC